MHSMRLPEPRGIRHSRDLLPTRHDAVNRNSLLSNVTLSIGSLRLRCEFAIERAEDPNPATPSPPDPDLEGPSHQDQGHRPGVVFWAAPIPDGQVASRDVQVSRVACAGAVSTGQRPQTLNGENCTVILSDVTGFGAHTRTDVDRRIIREALLSITHSVLRGIPDVWSWEDRGDGLLTVVPPSVPTARVIEQLHRALPRALDEHNRNYHDSAQIQLRVAINVGPVATDSMGVSGEAIIVTARLLEAPLFKKAMNSCGASLGLIASTFIYETVIRHGHTRAGYSNVQVDVKETNVAAWMKLFETAVSLAGESNPSVAS